MRGSGVALLVVALLAVAYIPQPAEAQASWQALVPILVDKVSGLWQRGSFELLDQVCSYSVKPKFRRWQLYYEGRAWCPGWPGIRGEALTRSQSGVVGKTVTDFVEKAHNAGKITEADAQRIINSK